MIFIINRLKYDTDKMELVSDKCECSYKYNSGLFGEITYKGKDVKLWLSNKGNWLVTYSTDYGNIGKAINIDEAKDLLLKYDLSKYEEQFGELEEA